MLWLKLIVLVKCATCCVDELLWIIMNIYLNFTWFLKIEMVIIVGQEATKTAKFFITSFKFSQQLIQLTEAEWHICVSKLDESTARRQLKSPQSLSGRSIHLTLVTKWSWSWSWMTHCHLLCAMSIGPPILRYSYFKIWPWKSMVKVMCVVKAQGHI